MEQVKTRFEEVRRSEYFPAILGAVAGGVTGALMGGIMSRGGKTQVVVQKEEDGKSAQQGVLLGYSPKELIQLVTVVAGLAKQFQEWRAQQERMS